jgi:NAD(P)-dependent dehydrogenase (short-subunit alcohol dehydrogenase family)
MTLTEKTAVVTGGSRGIGLAIARALLDAGANVAITATKQETLDAAADTLGGSGARERLLPLRADVRSYPDVERAMTKVAERFGGIQILVNNAGVGGFAPVADMRVEDWDAVIDTHLTGVLHCCRTALPYLKQQGGWIINVSSLSSKNPFPNGAAYCASKAALNAFSECLMQEVRYDNIRVAYVLPGSVNTGFGSLANTKADWALSPDDVAAVVTDLLSHAARSLPSRVEIRPALPPRKG